jgi:predicted amidophosphoribosyltransferase
MEKYYEKKAIRSGQKRLCKSCNSSLSRYNTLDICSKCEKNNSKSDRNKILRMINDSGEII